MAICQSSCGERLQFVSFKVNIELLNLLKIAVRIQYIQVDPDFTVHVSLLLGNLMTVRNFLLGFLKHMRRKKTSCIIHGLFL